MTATLLPCEATAFLDSLPHAVVNLVSICPNTSETRGITRRASSADLAEFIRAANGTRNLYFSVNEPKPGAPDKKLGKSDIALIHGICADLDAKGENIAESNLARAQRDSQVAELRKDAVSAPTILIDSGGGYGVFWLFPEPRTATSENIKLAEAQGLGLAEKLDGDHVQNVDRIMRLPGTLNIPDAKKRSRGRVAVPATLIFADGPRHQPDGLARLATPITGTAKTDDPDGVPIDMGLIREANTFLELPIALRQKIQNLELDHPNFAKMLAGDFDGLPMIRDRSRSGQLFALAAFLRAAGFSATEFARAAWIWPQAYHATWHNGDDAAVKRDLQRAWAACADGLSAYAQKTKAEDDFDPVERSKSPKHPFESFDTIEPNLKRRDLVKGLILSVSTVALIGPPGVGKSQALAYFAFVISRGLDLCGRKTRKGAVICAIGEGVEGFRGRLKAVRMTNPVAKTPIRVFGRVPNLLDRKSVQEFIDDCRIAGDDTGEPIQAVLLDTLTTCTPGMDQNSGEGMSLVVSALRLISTTLNCSVIVVHHTGKDQSKGARGSSVLIGDLDTELRIEADGKTRFRLIQSKQRDFERGAPLCFASKSIVIGQDADGENVTAIYAEPDTSSPEDDFGPLGPVPAPLDRQEQAVLDTIIPAGVWIPKIELQARFLALWGEENPDARVASLKASFRKIIVRLVDRSMIEARAAGNGTEYRA